MTMRDDHGLLAAILADPDDDALRLVYADFLEESGDVARAEFIRVQIERERVYTPAELAAIDPNALMSLGEREESLLAANRETWLSRLAPIRGLIGSAIFRRGLLNELIMDGVRDEHLPVLAAVPELEWLSLLNADITASCLSELAALPALRHIDLSESGIEVADLHVLVSAPRLVRVYNYAWQRSANPELEAFKEARNARFLSLADAERRREAVAAVRVLACCNPFGPEGEATSITLYRRAISDADLIYLTPFAALRTLHLDGNPAITSSGLRHLRGMPQLATLSLSGTGVTDLGPLRHLTSLIDLDMSSVPELDALSLRVLAVLTRLKNLDLADCDLGDEATDVLCRLRWLEGLKVTGNRFGPASLDRMRRMPRMRAFESDVE